MSPRTAHTSAPVLDVLAQRWSPRSFKADQQFPEGALRGMFEAARWAPSAMNSQPWRFILARRGGDLFERVAATLMGYNQEWATSAGALVVNIAETADAEGNERPWAEYDLGQAVALFTVQAQSEGYHAHQMGGFDRDAIRESFGLEDRFVPVSVTAIGALGDPDQLSEVLRARETAPRTRLPLDELFIARDGR